MSDVDTNNSYLASIEANRLAAIEERDRVNSQPDGFHYASHDHELAERARLLDAAELRFKNSVEGRAQTLTIAEREELAAYRAEARTVAALAQLRAGTLPAPEEGSE